VKRVIKRALANGAGIDMVRLLMSDNEKGEMKMFNYNPEDASSAWPAGKYEASIEKVEESLSKKNNDPMLIVHVQVYGTGATVGQKQTINEYITAPPAGSGRKGSLWKLKAIATAVGLVDKFKTKTLKPKELVGKTALVELGVEEDPKFGDKNVITLYEKLERLSPQKVAVAVGAEDEEVPF
jgi:hypothetical protein